MKTLRRNYPNEKILLVCRSGLGELFLKTGAVDQVFEIRKGDADSYRKIQSELSQKEIRLLISPHESWRTAFFCRKIKARKKISYASFAKGLFFDDLISKEKNLPEAIRQLSLLKKEDSHLQERIDHYRTHAATGAEEAGALLSPPPAWASMSLREELLKDHGTWEQLYKRLDISASAKKVLLFPGSVWNTKRWTQEGYEETGRALHKAGYEILVMGAPEEKQLAHKVARHIPGSHSIAARTSIYESLLLIARSSLVIGNDSAAIHMASAAEIPVVAVFGPTVLEFGFRPWNAKAAVVELKNLSCRPCGKHGHKKCPIGTHECMNGIAAEEVLRAARANL
jgi:heptosyltransferase-2